MPERGEIWLFNRDPVVCREQSGVRPGLIVSIDDFNHGPRQLVIIIPITTQQRPSADYPYHVELSPQVSELNQTSFAMCEQVRAVPTNRLYGRNPRGRVDPSTLQEIEGALRIILGL